MKIGIVGPESSGKSTLAEALAAEMQLPLFKEYGRTYMEQYKELWPYSFMDIKAIALQQIDEISHPAGIFDTELIITKVWFLHKYHFVPAWVDEAIKAYPMDCYILCYPDLPWFPDTGRENGDIRQALFDEYEQEIKRLCIPYTVIRHS